MSDTIAEPAAGSTATGRDTGPPPTSRRPAPRHSGRGAVPAQLLRNLGLAVALTAGLRVLSELVALVSAYGTTFPHLVARHPGVLVNVWAGFDTGWYVGIAYHWYPAAVHGHLPQQLAFAPLYPALLRATAAVTGLTPAGAGQLVSGLATVAGLAALLRLGDVASPRRVGGTSAMLLVAFPTAFFLMADYPDSLALALGAWAFLAARRRRWVVAGLLAGVSFFTVYYLAILAPALLVELWAAGRAGRLRAAQGAEEPARRGGSPSWRPLALGGAAVVGPAVAAVAAWMAWCASTYGDALAFVHVQKYWTRRFAFPWTLAHRTLSDLVHWRFLDTSTESVMELFDAGTTVLLLALAIYAYLRVRRSYGVLLFLALCIFVFQTMLYSQTREVLALPPFFVALGHWAEGHRWRERLLLGCFLPAAYYIIWRFATARFAD